MAIRNKGIENIETVPHVITQVYAVGDWLKQDGSGAVVPASAGDQPLFGLCGEAINVGDPEYSVAIEQIHVDQAVLQTDRFVMEVTTGSATASMIGSTFDLDTASTLDVSGAGAQFEITQVFSATLVEVALTHEDYI